MKFILENQEYGRGHPLHWPCDTLYPQKLELTSPKSGGRSVSIVRLRTKATEFEFNVNNEEYFQTSSAVHCYHREQTPSSQTNYQPLCFEKSAYYDGV
jgi:hypothetical protein